MNASSKDTAGKSVDELVRRSGTSFYWAMRFLPSAKRKAMFAIYAFCRAVDDIADGDTPVGTKKTELNAWREEISLLHVSEPRHPITLALRAPVNQFGLSAADFEAVIDGMETGAVDRLRLANDTELELYCDQVACAVGRLSVAVFGLELSIGHELAKALGDALQLTNILRDVDEDAIRNHVYMPADLLRRHGITTTDAMEIVRHPQLAHACDELADRAENKFEASHGILQRCNFRAARPAIMMMLIYHRLLSRLKQRGWHDRSQRVSVPPRQRLGIALRTFLAPRV